jgi:uncharacterized membrane protein
MHSEISLKIAFELGLIMGLMITQLILALMILYRFHEYRMRVRRRLEKISEQELRRILKEYE